MTFLRKHLWTGLRLAVAVGLLAYLFRSGAIQWSALRGLLSAWPLTVMAFALVLVDVVVTAWRLCVLMKPRGLHLSVVAATRLTLVGNFFNLCLPGATGGDAVRIYYAARENRGRRVEVATVLLLDRFVGMFALLLWPVLVAPFFWGLVRGSPVVAGLLAVAAVIAAGMALAVVAAFSTRLRHNRLLRWTLARVPAGRHIDGVLETVHTYRHTPGALLRAALVSVLAHTIAVGIMLLLAQAVAPGGADPAMSLLIPLGFLVNTIPLTPGGLGLGEAAFERLFALFGLAGGAEMLLSWRLLMALSGLIGLAFFLRGGQRFFSAAAVPDTEPRPARHQPAVLASAHLASEGVFP